MGCLGNGYVPVKTSLQFFFTLHTILPKKLMCKLTDINKNCPEVIPRSARKEVKEGTNSYKTLQNVTKLSRMFKDVQNRFS